MPKDLDRWRRAGKIGGAARDLGAGMIREGASRRDVAEEVEKYIRSQGGQPAFPVNLSINDEAAHFTPDPEDMRRFAVGDVVKVDVGAHLDGAISDTAATVEVGATKYASLVAATRSAVEAAERELRAGVETMTLSRAIERTIHALGFKPVENLTGHTIESYLLHAGKSVPNVTGMSTARLEPGEVVAIEPFATNGAGRIGNGAFGNIMRFREPPSAKKFPELSELFGRFRTLPFCARWVPEPELRSALLKARKRLQTYPVFVEEGHGWVSQAERTFLVVEGGCELLTP
ncbi:MAG: type II methionyl aminopeptidase [Euryarchaeota archaeon]|nr:type II methionyl aminopeptidase [Euryarchaeota archaeon]MDE1835606.1 type II methionyl aminopeptidase [Euryarchaeota archaeon]MDE1878954.1 type II methionyl aminopeptidase [Euryarchaeota archaeon]MDE2043772.1 type II methionyl aminopeptidase [Thermoplasmata archaeon]